jgi:hypothetical protein
MSIVFRSEKITTKIFCLEPSSSRLDLGLPTDWARIHNWIYPDKRCTVPVPANKIEHVRATAAKVPVLNSDWADFPYKAIPKEPETRIDIDRLEHLITLHEEKLLDHEISRARRTIIYLREGAPALQLRKLGSCLVENRLLTSVAKLAVLKTVNKWILKGFVAGPFKEPPLDNFRVNGMIAIIKGKRYFVF